MTDVRDIDSLRLHDAHDRVPMASGDDLANLRKSLAEYGQQDPVDITPDGVILDGRTRWTLLRQQGARTVRVREQDIPEGQQVAWIVDRALSRRHLSMAEKRALNDWLRFLVVDVSAHPVTGEERRMGMSQPQRAATLGVGQRTVQEWDKDGGSTQNSVDPPADAPTHFMRGGGNPTPYPIHPAKPVRASIGPREEKRRAVAKAKAKYHPPPWFSHFMKWVNRPLAEDRALLVRMDEAIHKAIALLEEGSDDDRASA